MTTHRLEGWVQTGEGRDTRRIGWVFDRFVEGDENLAMLLRLTVESAIHELLHPELDESSRVLVQDFP